MNDATTATSTITSEPFEVTVTLSKDLASKIADMVEYEFNTETLINMGADHKELINLVNNLRGED